MEHTQSVDYQPKRQKRLRKRKSRFNSSSNIFIHLLIHHPALLLTGVLTMLIVSAALAVYSLSYVDITEKAEPEEIAAVVETPMIISSESRNPTPFWLVFAIALSCAGGCALILRCINGVKKPRKVRPAKQVQHTPHRIRTTNNSQGLPVLVPLPPPNQIILKRAKSNLSVMVIPSKHQRSQAKSQQTLAELMDIRQQNSLSTILQDNL
jgi:hypothetical protein